MTRRALLVLGGMRSQLGKLKAGGCACSLRWYTAWMKGQQRDEPRSQRIQISVKPSDRVKLKRLAYAHDRSEAEQVYRLLAMSLEDAEEVMKRPALVRALEIGYAALNAMGDEKAADVSLALRRLRKGDQLEFDDLGDEEGSPQCA